MPREDEQQRLRTAEEPGRSSPDITLDTDLTDYVRLWVNTTGWIKVTLADDSTGHEYYVLAGSSFPGLVKKVWSTNTHSPIAEVRAMK